MRSARADARNPLRQAQQLRAALDPDVHHHGRLHRLHPRRRRPLRGAGTLAHPRARRPRDLQPRGLRAFLGDVGLQPGHLCGHRQDGHPRDAQARLPRRRRGRLHRGRRHAGHPDPALRHHDRLRHRHRNLDRPAVPRRGLPGAPAGGALHGLVALRHLAPRATPRSCSPTRYSWRQRIEILPRVLPFLAIIVGVLYAMYGGIATPSETAAVGALLCLVIAMVIYRLWSPTALWVVLRDSTRESVMILFIIAAAGVFSYMLSSLFITQSIAALDRHAGRQPLGADGRHPDLPADRRLLPAAGRGDPDGGADPAADHHHRGLRSDLVRRDPHHQHGDRADLAARRPQPLRDQRHRARHQAQDDPHGIAALCRLHGARDRAPLHLPRHRHLAARPR